MMSDAWLGVLVSASLIGIGIFLLSQDPAKRLGRASPTQLRRGGILGIVFGAIMTVVTVSLFLRGGK